MKHAEVWAAGLLAFESRWDEESKPFNGGDRVPLFYESIQLDPDGLSAEQVKNLKPYASVLIQFGGTSSTIGSPGNRLRDTVGQFAVGIAVPMIGDAVTTALQLAEIARAAFDESEISELEFQDPRIEVAAEIKPWLIVNVIAPFVFETDETAA